MLALVPLVAAVSACEDFGPGAGGQGELRWVLDHTTDVLETRGLEASLETRGLVGGTRASSAEIPDTNDFILKVTDSQGKVIYEGSYGESPESVLVDAGSYTVSIVSIPFTAPGFSKPQYGDEQVVVVKAGASVTVKLTCTLRNAGVRLQVASDFLTAFPNGVLYLKSNEGKLMYAYSEKRVAYFKPGAVALLLYQDGKDETLLTRTLAAQDMLTLRISAPNSGQAGGSHISVAVDTTRNYRTEDFVIGGNNGGSGGGNSGTDTPDAYSVAEAGAHAGENDVWVYGYIVGGDLSTAGSTVKTSGIGKSTHLAIADRASTTAKSSCVAVELPSGAVREALNLVDHPDLIGSRVYVKGNLVEAYFGTTGLKGTKDFVLK